MPKNALSFFQSLVSMAEKLEDDAPCEPDMLPECDNAPSNEAVQPPYHKRNDKPYYIYRKAGRCADGFGRGGGSVYHVVPRGEYKALCGTKPGRLSHWSSWQGDRVTCKRCGAKLDKEVRDA